MQSIQRTELAGVRVFRYREGTGLSDPGRAALVFLHGGPGMDESYFHPYLDPLADSAELVFYTHGQTRGGGIDALVSEVASLVAGLRSEDVERPVYLLGHSFGGTLALEYMRRHPGHGLAGLVLVAWVYDGHWFELARKRSSAVLDAIAASIGVRAAPAETDPDRAYRQITLDYLPAYFTAAALAEGRRLCERMTYDGTLFREVGGGYLKSVDHSGFVEIGLKGLRVLSVAGAEDALVTTEYIDRALARNPSIFRQVLPDAGHFPFVEKPREFNALIRKFLKEGTQP